MSVSILGMKLITSSSRGSHGGGVITTPRNFIAIKRPAQVLFVVELKLFIYSAGACSLLVFYFVFICTRQSGTPLEICNIISTSFFCGVFHQHARRESIG
jgi:hypothetical protein